MPTTKNNTLRLHSTLAHEIKAAKKTLFRRHREGLPLRMAANQFVVDITQRLKKISFPDAVSDNSEGRSAESAIEIADDDPETSHEVIQEWARTICQSGDDAEEKTKAFLLLMDEIELSSRDYLRVGSIVWTAEREAFGCSDYADQARQRLIGELKAERRSHEVPDEAEDEANDDHVDVLLPNGKELRLYGDAAETAKEGPTDFRKVIESLHELFHNPATPSGLFEKLCEFTCEQSNEVGDEFYHSPTVLGAVLASVKPEETQGAIIAARQEREKEQAN